MKEKGISQEGLKLIACVTMLIDHIGAVLGYEWYMVRSMAAGVHLQNLWDLYMLMRIIGRIAFPIYCFMLVEGAYRTRNPRKYGARLAVGVLLAEIPFDLAFSGGWDWSSNSVMITLLLGFCMIEAMKRVKILWKCLLVIPFWFLAEKMMTDYAGHGILIIAFLALIKDMPYERLLRALGMIPLLAFGATIPLGYGKIYLELFGLIALIPISCYSGKKRTYSKAAQWAFYLFYPVHLMLLWFLRVLIFGAQYPV